MSTPIAPKAGKAACQDTARKKFAELPLDEHWQAIAVAARSRLREEGLEVLLENPMKHAVLWLPGHVRPLRAPIVLGRPGTNRVACCLHARASRARTMPANEDPVERQLRGAERSRLPGSGGYTPGSGHQTRVLPPRAGARALGINFFPSLQAGCLLEEVPALRWDERFVPRESSESAGEDAERTRSGSVQWISTAPAQLSDPSGKQNGAKGLRTSWSLLTDEEAGAEGIVASAILNYVGGSRSV